MPGPCEGNGRGKRIPPCPSSKRKNESICCGTQMNCEEMIRDQIVRRGVKTPCVLDAMRTVPRERFVPEDAQPMAYADCPLPIGCGQTISQPYIVALMTELLQLDSESNILEIGTGSGYQAAVLAQIVDKVYSMEILSELAENTRKLFCDLGYDNIITKFADGTDGWEEHAPYDGIIVTAAAPVVPEKLKEQLKIGGTMVIPVGEPSWIQSLDVITRTKHGYEQIPNISVRFVPMTGKVSN